MPGSVWSSTDRSCWREAQPGTVDLGDLRGDPGSGVRVLLRLRRLQTGARARPRGWARRDPVGAAGYRPGLHEPGAREHPEPCGRFRGRRARHLPVGQHDRDPDPGSVEQHRAAAKHGHLLHRGSQRGQLRVLRRPVRRPGGVERVHGRVATEAGVPVGRQR